MGSGHHILIIDDSIPVLVLSGESDLPQVAHSLGVPGYFTKPVDFAQLLAALRVLGRDRSPAPVVAGAE